MSHNFKVGDKVRISRRIDQSDFWLVPEMRRTLGEVGEVKKIDTEWIYVTFFDHPESFREGWSHDMIVRGWAYRPKHIEPVDESIPQKSDQQEVYHWSIETDIDLLA